MTAAEPVPATTLSLCSGYGGLDKAVETVTGAAVTWQAEIDPGASMILAERFPGVPNLGDLTALPWEDIPADVVCGGFPCQPVSAAGARKGVTDDRWLFDDICAGVGRMDPRPRLLVFENVPGLLTANGGDAMARVVQGLAALGYVGRWRTLAAADVGAPHRRERVFIIARLADTAHSGRHELNHASQPRPDDTQRSGRPQILAGDDRGIGVAAGDADVATVRERRQPGPRQAQSGWSRPDARGPGGTPATDAYGSGVQTRDGRPGTRQPQRLQPLDSSPTNWGPYAPAIARWEHVLGRPAPRPTEPGRTGERLSPRFVEWMQGLPDGWVCDVPGLSRNAQLKALGNGVVPQQATQALCLLLGATT